MSIMWVLTHYVFFIVLTHYINSGEASNLFRSKAIGAMFTDNMQKLLEEAKQEWKTRLDCPILRGKN